jgi:hypothetical protein
VEEVAQTYLETVEQTVRRPKMELPVQMDAAAPVEVRVARVVAVVREALLTSVPVMVEIQVLIPAPVEIPLQPHLDTPTEAAVVLGLAGASREAPLFSGV